MLLLVLQAQLDDIEPVRIEEPEAEAEPEAAPPPPRKQSRGKGAKSQSDAKAKTDASAAAEPEPEAEAEAEAEAGAEQQPARRRRRATSESVAAERDEVAMSRDERGDAATGLLERALRILHQKSDDEWLHANVVKEQMKRMDPVFNEKSLGHKSFTDFITARDQMVDMREEGQARLLQLKTD